jgi:cell division protein FtsB
MLKSIRNKLNFLVYVVFFLFAFWIFYIIIYGNGGLVNRSKVERQLTHLEAEIQKLETDNSILEWEIDNLRYNRTYIEAFARELGYKKEGEIIYRFMKKEEKLSQP